MENVGHFSMTSIKKIVKMQINQQLNSYTIHAFFLIYIYMDLREHHPLQFNATSYFGCTLYKIKDQIPFSFSLHA